MRELVEKLMEILYTYDTDVPKAHVYSEEFGTYVLGEFDDELAKLIGKLRKEI